MIQLELVKKVFETEAEAILKSAQKIDGTQLSQMSSIFDFLTQTGGSLVVSGVGSLELLLRKSPPLFLHLVCPLFLFIPRKLFTGILEGCQKMMQSF